MDEPLDALARRRLAARLVERAAERSGRDGLGLGVGWGAIWGALLVGAPTGIFGVAAENQGAFLGALLTGLAIGCAAGLLCASLFLAIVRPKQQLSLPAADVF